MLFGRLLIFTFIIVIMTFPSFSQDFFIRKICDLPSNIRETSGLVYMGENSFVTINDKGNDPIVFQFDTNGTITNETKLYNTTNIDWETLSIKDDSFLIVGDVGNQLNQRKDLGFYTIPIDSLIFDFCTAVASYFNYEDQVDYPPKFNKQHFDCEASVFYKDEIYFFTKDRSIPYEGESHVYRVLPEPGLQTAYRVGEYITNTNYDLGSITGAAISPDNTKIALISYGGIFIFHEPGITSFSNSQFITTLLFKDYARREAICFKDESTLYYTQEAWEEDPASLWEVKIDANLSINEENNFVDITMSKGQLKINNRNQKECNIYIYNYLGQLLISHKTMNSQTYSIDHSNEILIVVIVTDNSTMTKKITNIN